MFEKRILRNQKIVPHSVPSHTKYLFSKGSLVSLIFQIDGMSSVATISNTFTKPLTYNWDKHNFSINVQQDIDRLLVLKF